METPIMSRFKDEEVTSTCGYLFGYKPKGIAEQIKILRKLFPGLGTADESIAEKPLPAGAEGWFAIPRYELVMASYNDAVQKVLDLIKKDRKGNFYNWLEGRISPQYLRQTERAVRFWKKLGEEQKGHDILIVPAQFVIRLTRAITNSSEFNLGSFAVGVMLLTNLERLKHYDDLWVHCAGDEYSPDGNGVFSHAPIFRFHDGKVKFFAYWVAYAYELYGSASGFVSQ